MLNVIIIQISKVKLVTLTPCIINSMISVLYLSINVEHDNHANWKGQTHHTYTLDNKNNDLFAIFVNLC